jgi:hypothetical protein
VSGGERNKLDFWRRCTLLFQLKFIVLKLLKIQLRTLLQRT